MEKKKSCFPKQRKDLWEEGSVFTSLQISLGLLEKMAGIETASAHHVANMLSEVNEEDPDSH